MIRKLFKSKKHNPDSKLGKILDKYNIPREYFSINRKSVSKGVLVGLFWGFIPMPMQMLAVILTTPFIRFNVPIAISMVWLSNPITMPPMYYMEYLTGNLILGKPGIEHIEMTLDWFEKHIGDIFIPLYVGTAFYSIVVSYLIYLIINCLWIRSVKIEKHHRERLRRERKKREEAEKSTSLSH